MQYAAIHDSHKGYWRENSAGYTFKLQEAGRFELTKAQAIVAEEPDNRSLINWGEVENAKLRFNSIPIRLPCPECGTLHIDEGEWETKPHHTHACQNCGNVWRPAVVNTVGVQFLPGFKNG